MNATMSNLHLVRDALRCPICGARFDASSWTCTSCGAVYEERSGVPVLLDASLRQEIRSAMEADRENAFLNFFKRWPALYRAAVLVVSSSLFTGPTVKKFLRRFRGDELFLNAGSGPTREHPRVVNLDVYPFPNVDVVGHVNRLPFADGTFDAVCSEQVLEHVEDPFSAVRELVRVTKPGGSIFVAVPFVFPWHPSPKDYSRWTVDGLRSLFSSCAFVEGGVVAGPASGFSAVLTAWLAITFSFGIRPLRKLLHYVFLIVTSPVKLLDIVYARLPGAEGIAAGVYVVVKKAH